MRLGVALPIVDIGGGPEALREFVQAAEEIGYHGIAAPDHVLGAKQAACLDVLSGGRFRLGVGVGWNEVEFTGLNENFRNRGLRSEEQVEVMRALWSKPHVTFKGRWHTIDD